jgi:hypothetical protein
MKNKKILFAFSILILVMLACNTVLPSTESPTLPTVSLTPLTQNDNNGLPRTDADVPRISVEEAKVAIDSGAILVDVRNAQPYAELHAKDAVSIPLDVFETNINSVSLEKTDWIITYCT